MGSVEWAWALVGQGHLFSFIFFVRRVGQLLGRGLFFGLFFVLQSIFTFVYYLYFQLFYICIEKQTSHKTFQKMLTKHLKILHVYKENDYHMYKKDTMCVEKVDHALKNVNRAFKKC